MKSPLYYFKNRSVRLGLLAVFVATTMGLPALGYTLNVDVFKKFDVLNLGDNLLLATTCDNEGHCWEEMAPVVTTPPSTGGTYVPPTTTTGGTTTTTGGTTTTTTTTTTGGTYVPPTTGTYVDPATGMTQTYTAPSTSTDWNTFTDWNAAGEWSTTQYQVIDWGAVDWTNVEDPNAIQWDAVPVENWGAEEFQNTDWSSVGQAWGEDQWTQMDWTQMDFSTAGQNGFEGEMFQYVDWSKMGEDQWQNMSYEKENMQYVDYGTWDPNAWKSFAEHGDMEAVEGVWSMGEYKDFYSNVEFDSEDKQNWAQEDWSRYYTATAPVTQQYGDYSNYHYDPMGASFWNEWTDNSMWSEYDASAGIMMDGEGNTYMPTDYGFMKDMEGQFFDMEGNKFMQQGQGKFADYFADESGQQYFAREGNMYEWDEEQGFKHDFGGQEFHSDYWFTGEFNWDEEYEGWTDMKWEDFEYSWEGFEGYDPSKWLQPMPPVEFEEQYSALEGEFETFANPEMDWGLLQKQTDYLVDELQTTVDLREVQADRYVTEGVETAPLEETVDTLNTVLATTQEVLSEMDILEFLQESDLASVEQDLAGLDEDSTVAEVETAELNLTKMETYEVLQGAMDPRNTQLEVLGEMADMIEEMGVAEQAYLASDLEVPSEMDAYFEEFQGTMDEILAYEENFDAKYEDVKALVEDIRGSTDPSEIEQLMEESWAVSQEMEVMEDEMLALYEEFSPEEQEDVVDEYLDYAHGIAQTEDMIVHIEMMTDTISTAATFIDIVGGLNPSDESTSRAVEELDGLADQGLEVLGIMQAYLEEGSVAEDPAKVMDFWKAMDTMGYAAETYMDTLVEWVEANPTALEVLSESDQAVVQEKVSDWDNYYSQEIDYTLLYENYGFEEYEEWDDADHFEDANEYEEVRFEMADTYTNLALDDRIDFDSFVAQIEPDEVNTITREIPETVVEEMAIQMAELGETAQETLAFALNNAGVVGADLMENTVEVFEIMDDISIDDARQDLIRENPEVQTYLYELEDLYEETQATLIASDTQEALEMAWEDARLLLELGGEIEEFATVVEEIEMALEENEEDLIFEEGVAFADVSSDDWFYSSVMEAREEGVVNGYKDANGVLTGAFDPAAPISNAEALKMIFEAAGTPPSGVPEDVSAVGQWFEGYVAQAEEMGLSDLGAWGAPCDRGTVAVWVSEVFDLGGEDYDYEGVFTDVSASNPDAGHYQAVYEYGIFEGDAGSATLRPNDEINRAEVSKVVMTAGETAGSLTEVFETIEDLESELSAFVDVQPEVEVAEEENFNFFDMLKKLFSSVLSF